MIGGVIGAAMVAATAGIGSIAVPCSGMTQMTANSLNFLNLLIRSSAHAALNGGMRLIQGGRVELGLMPAFFSSVAMGGAGMVNNMSSLGFMIIGAAVGGTAEALGGGKFANGAIMGAFVGLFNHGLHQNDITQEDVNNTVKIIDLTSVNAGQELVDLMERIEKNDFSGDITEAINFSDLEMIDGETYRSFHNSYNGHGITIVVTTLDKNASHLYFMVGANDYVKYGSYGHGRLSIKGQPDFIGLIIQTETTYNEAYDQIFGN